jgi:hypothetical protein
MNIKNVENVVVQNFWEEHIEKSRNDYDPYHYIDDMSLTGEEMLIDFNWEEEQEEEEEEEEEEYYD